MRLLGRGPEGQALVEFALVLLIVLLLMLGIVDFGRAIFASNSMSHASREATRQASVSPLDCESVYYVVQRQTRASESVTVSIGYRKPPATSDPNPAWNTVSCPAAYDPSATYDFDPATGAWGSVAPAPQPEGEIRVVVTDDVTIATPLISNIVGGSIAVDGESAMKVSFTPVP